MSPLALTTTPLSIRLIANLWEIGMMIGWTVVGWTLLIDPGAAARSPVGRELASWSWAWALIYVTCAPIVVGSIAFGRGHRWRVAGLTMVSAALVMQGIAAATAVPIDPRTFNYFMWAFFGGIMAMRLARILSSGGRI